MLIKYRPIVLMICSLILLCGVLSTTVADDAAPEQEYRLDMGDKVRISIYGHDDLSGEFEVDTVGKISLPLAGDVSAAGLTINELESAITDALQPEYLKNPLVSAELLDYRPFYIFGEVNVPGSYPYSSGMTVINAVAVAGGYTYRAKKKRIRITRGRDENQVEFEGDGDTPILPGDVIEVPERFF